MTYVINNMKLLNILNKKLKEMDLVQNTEIIFTDHFSHDFEIMVKMIDIGDILTMTCKEDRVYIVDVFSGKTNCVKLIEDSTDTKDVITLNLDGVVYIDMDAFSDLIEKTILYNKTFKSISYTMHDKAFDKDSKKMLLNIAKSLKG